MRNSAAGQSTGPGISNGSIKPNNVQSETSNAVRGGVTGKSGSGNNRRELAQPTNDAALEKKSNGMHSESV